MAKEKIQRKKIEIEIRRLYNLLTYCKLDKETILFINNDIKRLQSQLGY